MTSLALPRTLTLATALLLLACTDDLSTDAADDLSETGETDETDETGDEDGDSTEVDPEVVWPILDCDPLVPDYCGFPYPNNVFSIDDPDSPTGRRLAFTEALVPAGAGYQPDPDVWLDSDGFSPAGSMLAYFPGVSVEGLPSPTTIEASLAADSPTILLNADSGARVPHWAELDMSHGDDGRRAFIIRPAVRLEPETRYIVAVRGLVDQGGAAIEASPGFAALRDISPSEDPSIEARRGLYADIFLRLGDAGIGRDDLQLAWDFTTASDANLTERLVHIRDEGLALFDEDPQFSIVEVELDPGPGLAMRVTGELQVPLYLDDPGPAGRMTFGADGLPEPNGTTTYPFMVLIPTEAFSEPAGLMQFGHGLFGSYEGVDDSLLTGLAVDYNFVVFATSWLGMSNQDLAQIVSVLQTARLDDFATIADRLSQGVFNGLAAMRMMRGSFANAPEIVGPNMEPLLIDADRSYFFGASLGGIMGSTYMALTTDVERGALGVPGQPYGLLLNRSEAFVELGTLSNQAYDDKLDLRFSLEMMQLLWDRAEPSGFSRHVVHDPLPGTSPHEVIVLAALGDHLVTNFGTHVMARELGIPQLEPIVRPVFGIDEVAQPYAGSALIEYDFGLPPIPLTNVPMTAGSDPHGALADVPNALYTVEQFLRTGVVESFCNGVCDPS
ncbi:hypothetical protein [Enhygromyxa salina]|nr:hypothetical protein [Enhygromyxa salina]